ncbi:hypothetical protein GFS24_03265 [Chitinophaga sp. SYP-B3965]|uniref:hypothetical protein n=1 Tax=Chitinophaga sp. SYP-B3965 TaxID=2663120 RepID=UPI001299C752|nr:hypothetical protein [Chitinophaga sp. SYP-B3965]MRG44114.1 hypothetical protein [Chitinophaga sp. SYP-B3965]
MSRTNWTAEQLFTRLLHNKSDKTYWENIRELRKRDGITATCYTLAASGSDQEKELAVDVLAHLPYSEQKITLYFELLQKGFAIRSVLYAIGHNNEQLNTAQINTIAAFKDHADKEIREAVAYALLGVDHMEAIHTLIALSMDKVSAIRSWAVFGIASRTERNNPDIITALWNRINDKHEETRFEAIVGLAVRKDDRVKDIIKRELLTGDFGSLLFEAITELGDNEFLPLLEAHLDDDADAGWLHELRECIDSLKG